MMTGFSWIVLMIPEKLKFPENIITDNTYNLTLLDFGIRIA